MTQVIRLPQQQRPEPEETLPREVVLAFAPLHKRAFGIATGSAAALLVFLATAVSQFHPPEEQLMVLLAQYFYGYSVSWPGAVIGAWWGFVAGFVAGWFTAFCRNLVLAVMLFITRTRAELAATRDFLDHI